MWKQIILVSWLLILSLLSLASADCEDHSDILNKLSELISNEQVKETRDYYDVTHMQETEGTYRGYIFPNAVGPEGYTAMRRKLLIQDDMVFPSGFVGPQIIDAYRFSNAPMPPREDIMRIVKTEGTYRGYIFPNAVGPEGYTAMRRKLLIQDDMAFPPGFVGPQIIDAYRFSNAPMPPREDIMRIVKLFVSNQNQNLDYNNSMLSFYPQKYNPLVDQWQAYSINLMKAMQAFSTLPMPMTQSFLPLALGSPQGWPKGMVDLISPENTAGRFILAADFDTSSLNLAVGSILSELRDTYPEAWGYWRDSNMNLTSMFDRLKRNAYRPFSDDRSINTIDTRSYYYMREYLDKAYSEGRDIALVPCWDMNINTEQTFGNTHGSLSMGVNFIEAGIGANFINDVFLSLDSGLIEKEVVTDDEDLNMIVDSVGGLIIHVIESNFSGRPDFAILAYGAEYEFYWLLSRGLLYMENAKLKGTLKTLSVYEKYYNGLSESMRTTVTNRLMNKKNVDEDGAIYFDDFLGNDDYSADGSPIVRGEDRYFSTANVAISMIYSWSVYDESLGHLQWIDSTPEDVKALVYGVTRWLVKHPFGGEYGICNAAYGADLANLDDFALWFPANRFERFNGTKIENFDKIEGNYVILGMEGYVPPAEYNEMLEKTQFGYKPSIDFHGRNAGPGSALYWRIDALSYASAMMAISMTDALQMSDNYCV